MRVTNPGQPNPGPNPPPQQVHTTVSTGLPIWMHVLYATLGWIPCFIGWIIWPIHWWFAQSKAKTTTTVQASNYPPPRPAVPGRAVPPWLVAGVVVGAIIVVCVGGTVALRLNPSADSEPARDLPSTFTTRQVRLEVTADDGTASRIDWSTVDGTTPFRDVPASAQAPWVHETTVTRPGLVTLNVSDVPGNVSCRLFIDGILVAEEGPSIAVNCYDRLP